jgi:hypothetical protein
VTFSEAMFPGTAWNLAIQLRNSTNASFDLVPASIVYDAATHVATLTPTDSLLYLTQYTVIVNGGSVFDLAGNTMTGTLMSTFTTAARPDNVAPTARLSGFFNGEIIVVFSEPMDPATINFATFKVNVTPSGATVVGTITYYSGAGGGPAGPSAHLVPSTPLAPNTSYTVTITTGVKDVAGNPLAATYTATFVTPP